MERTKNSFGDTSGFKVVEGFALEQTRGGKSGDGGGGGNEGGSCPCGCCELPDPTPPSKPKEDNPGPMPGGPGDLGL